jgi:DNA-binding beta-propeller fold protein YncE
MTSMGTRVVRAATLPVLAALLAASGAAAAGPAPAVSAAVGRPAGTAAHAPAAPGARLWISRLPGSGGRSVAVSPDGRTVYAAGTTDDGKLSDDDFVTIAYDTATGHQLWSARYNGPGNGEDIGQAVGTSPGGRTVYVAGTSDGGATGDDYAVVAYQAATGQRLWAARYDGPAGGTQIAAGMAVAPSGAAVYVTGFSENGPSGTDFATVAVSPANGQQQWAARYNGAATGSDTAYAIAAGPSGRNVFVTGQSNGHFATVAYRAATGHQVWARRYRALRNGGDTADAIAAGPHGGQVYVTGSSFGGRTDADYATVAYRGATGQRIWVRRYNGADRIDQPAAVAAGPSGQTVFVTGFSYGRRTGADYATVAYRAATGAPLWARRYNGPANGFDRAFALAVSPDGRTVYVTGNSAGKGTGRDVTTVAYRAATGVRLWLKRYSGPGRGFDGARAIAVSPGGGRVYVTGTSAGPGGSQDFVTIAYRS